MGSPDLPPNENNISRPAASNLPMHGGNTTASDDSDMEIIDSTYLGYQPLNLDEETMEYRNEANEQANEYDDDNDDGDDDFDYSVCIIFLFISFIIHRDFISINVNLFSQKAFNAPTIAPETGIVVPSIDAEIESAVWNAPRPESSNIVLDSTRTEQVIHFVMLSIRTTK